MKTGYFPNEERANSANYTVLSISKMFDKSILKGQQDTPLTSQDIETIDQLIHHAVETYNAAQMARYKAWIEKNQNVNTDRFLIDLAKYRRQYFCAANDEGEKEVWVNCFCDEPKWWRTGLVFVLDGGKCYFQLAINLHTKKVLSFATNGEA
ncbi:hypothetical protein [Hymenobacter terrenus]|uniref:hypothetical protein n=1 Tax=Hymenobacter terrenus TaxID=1629124 RepID=UPI00061905DC|nr:hypothetical protein [Hymenobacter terrenus]